MRTYGLLKFISQCSHRSISSKLDAVSNGHGYTPQSPWRVARVEHNGRHGKRYSSISDLPSADLAPVNAMLLAAPSLKAAH